MVLSGDEIGFASLVMDDGPEGGADENERATAGPELIKIVASSVTVRLPADSVSHRIARIAAALVREVGPGATSRFGPHRQFELV